MKIGWLLSVFIFLMCCEISLQGLTHLLAKKFVGAKFFKKMKALKQCDLVWENVEHPHCETSWDRWEMIFKSFQGLKIHFSDIVLQSQEPNVKPNTSKNVFRNRNRNVGLIRY